MAIERVGRPIASVRENANTKEAKSIEMSERRDRVELSEESKLLYAADKVKKIGVIRAKVKNGFYESPEVTEKVVEELLRELKVWQS